jgi:N-acetylglucosaminyldiphosphoundecaprenol N-acetyl-beta-D-mannosaminyltransferase
MNVKLPDRPTSAGAAHRVQVAGVWIDVVTTDDVLALARRCVAESSPAYVVTVNAEFIVRAQTDAQFGAALKRAALATPDGSGILWALRRRGFRLDRRVGGSDLIWELSEQARRLGHRVFLLGGAEGVAERAARRLQRTYAGLRIAGAHAGTPSPSDEDGIVDLIRRSEADILFVAFGAPQQELWIARSLMATGASFSIGVGGSFDYLAGTARRAPVWMRESGVEWLWRLARQPWRWRRMLALPRFVWLVLKADPRAPRPEGDPK